MELKPDQESILLNAARLRRRHDAQVPKCLNIIAYQLPSRLASVTRRWLASATNKVEAINRRGNMTSAPSWNQQNWTTPPKSDNQRDDLVRDLESSNNQNSGKRSIGRRVSRAFALYFIVFLLGIGLTLAWQSHGDEAMEMVRTEVPSLAWLLPVSTTKPSPDSQASAAAPVTPDELVEQLKPLAFELANVQRSVKELSVNVEQLGVKVNQMSQSIVLQSVEKKSPPPPQSRVPPPKPPQPPGQ